MALVAYGSSDSETEDEVIPSEPLLSARKQAKTVKITIPSLQEFKEENPDVEPPKKLKTKSGSGLFSILPPPKFSGSENPYAFTPHTLTKKKVTKSPSSIKPIVKKKSDGLTTSTPDSSITSQPEVEVEDNEENSGPCVDYFSLDSKSDLPPISSDSVLFSSLPEPSKSTDAYEPETEPLPSHSNDELELPSAQQCWNESYSNDAGQSSVDRDFMNDERFKKIKGKHDTKNIDFIDINAGDQLTSKDQWIMQNLTEEKAERPSKKRHGMPTQQQKRKHQITYLAFQAKERELDLKNQWSLNNRTRRETQAKYGF